MMVLQRSARSGSSAQLPSRKAGAVEDSQDLVGLACGEAERMAGGLTDEGSILRIEAIEQTQLLAGKVRGADHAFEAGRALGVVRSELDALSR
jgi:hypothetical protein